MRHVTKNYYKRAGPGPVVFSFSFLCATFLLSSHSLFSHPQLFNGRAFFLYFSFVIFSLLSLFPFFGHWYWLVTTDLGADNSYTTTTLLLHTHADIENVDDELFSGNETSVEPSAVEEEGAVSELTPVVYVEEDENENEKGEKKQPKIADGNVCSCEFCYPAILTAVYWFIMWAVLILLANDSTR